LVDDDPAKQGMQFGGAVVEGPCSALPHLADKHQAEEVVLAISHEMNTGAVQALMICFERGIDIVPAVSATERALGRVPLQHLGNRWLPSTFWATNPMPLFYNVFKRGLDIMVSAVLLITAAPLIFIAALATRLSSRGPAFYRQKRVGLHGKVFTIAKIRSMIDGAETDGAQWASQDDPRVTRLGKFLRATRIDELPQLWNVLRGDMSLVGPRPERPEFVEKLEKEIPFYRARLAVRPGITGWAQIKHRYASSVEDTKTKIEYDLYYIKHRWFWLDLLILGKTLKTVLTMRGM